MDSLGTVFRQARENRKLTIEQVFEVTYIPKSSIKAIEEEHFDELPGNAYCLGFVNKLGKFYGLDSKMISALYNEAKLFHQSSGNEGMSKSTSEKNDKKQLFPHIVLGVFIAAVIVVMVFSVLCKSKNETENSSENALSGDSDLSEENPGANANLEFVSENEFSAGISREPVVIYNSPEKKVFTVYIEFTGYCFFRYKINSRTPVEKYFQKGDRLKLDVNNEVKLWMSNAGVLKCTVFGKEIFFGNNGTVSTDRIQWEKLQDGSYNLTVETAF